ncbi:MucBP domain-containing protein [Candidatus Enterococcus mansonii]|uniref:Gram-positive cocci surface proteins LPxTG domain-containing protein n=1 Tax=Candidatus Enterococcus mansonii TaxID=1834181 RepID=A0A242CE47_9ENTE|nr:MucBP domain-containing protein [Enterococcus sp. 4G2_DIV0659]OTO08052.1 hypothetical protein A5880_002322 [Enterococcus sp. 4G2_DIV0659]
MKKRNNIRILKKTTIHTVMLLALLAPSFLTFSLVFAEDSTLTTEQANMSQLQASEETAETSFDSTETVESSTLETQQEPAIVPNSDETEVTTTTTDSTVTSEATTFAAPKDDIVIITDPFLKQEIITALRLPDGSELTKTDLERLTYLDLRSSQISSLSGLEHARNLTTIYNNTDNNITDFSPLEQLSSLTYVTLQTRSLTSANFPDLSKSTGITNLSLGSTSIDNEVLPKIAQLRSLVRIYMDSNINITTIAPFKALPNLKSLSVQFCGITDFTVINDFPALNDLAAFGQNTGRSDLPTTLGRSSLDYDFDQETLFIPFSIMPNRLTNFDGYIPPFTTSNSASNTYFAFNGEQLPASRLQITEQGITVLGVTKDEFVALSSFKYNARLNNLAGTYAKPEGFTFYAISAGTYLHQFNIVNDGKPVTVHYQDTEGNKLLESETHSGLVGQSFEFSASTIPNYRLVETQGETSGTFSDQEQTITFVYKKITAPIIEPNGKVIIRYMDTNNKNIINPIEKSDTVGSPFETEKLVFDGYTFKEVKGNTSGLFTEEDQEVTYIYSKNDDKTEPTTSTDSTGTEDTTSSTTDNTSTTETRSAVTNKLANTSTSTSESSKTSDPENKQKLPSTGEQQNNLLLVLGLIVVGFLSFVFFFKKAKQKK